MFKVSGIYRAPSHVQAAWAKDPALHKLLSSAGGKARARALLKAKKPNPPKQLEFNFPEAAPTSTLNPTLTPEEAAEGFRLIRAMLQKESTIKQAWDPVVDPLVTEADSRLSLKKSLGFGDPQSQFNEVNLNDAQIKRIIGKVRSKKEQRNRKILATLLGGVGGGLTGAVISRNLGGTLIGAGIGGLGINRVQSRFENSANKLTDDELKKIVSESMRSINESKKSKVNQAVGGAQLLSGAAGIPAALTQTGALAATIGSAAALPELTDTQMQELVKNAPIKNKQNLKVIEPHTSRIFDANAYYDPGKHSVEATSRHTWKPGIMAHELGHAELQGSKSLAGWLQRNAYTPTTLLNTYGGGLPTSIATYLTTKNDDDVSTGALKGLAVGSAANAGVLIPEFEASRRGIANILKSTQLSKGQKLLNSLSMAPAFLTYLIGTGGVQAGVGGLNAYYNRKRKEKENTLTKASHFKTAKSYELIQLIEAKKKSDARDFTGKNHIIQTLTHKYPQNFKVDSRLNRAYVGLTHTPTGFKIHAPKKILPAEILK